MDSAMEHPAGSGNAGPGNERRTVRVSIYNQPYTLTATGEPGEVEALALTVDELMTTIAASSARLDPQRLAVLACMHLADRLREAEQELARVKSRVDHKARQLTMLLEQTAE